MSAPSEEFDFLPTASWDSLRRRAELLAQLRRFFTTRGFLEVETPLLSAEVVVDRHLDPFATQYIPAGAAASATGSPLWLQTSPEAAMKRLMAAGGEAIFQVTRSFRNGERGRLHNPEFTLVEWYRRGDDLQPGMQLLCELVQTLLATPLAELLSYGDAFARYCGFDPHQADVAEIAAAARRAGIAPPPGFETADRDSWLQLLLAERIEPQLGQSAPTLLYHYPPSQAALAQVDLGPPPVAERFELYVQGVELANGFHELRDASVLRERMEHENAGRRLEGKQALPGPQRLLSAMEHGLPDCCGVALGFDRLVMLALGAQSIDEVIAFPIDRA